MKKLIPLFAAAFFIHTSFADMSTTPTDATTANATVDNPVPENEAVYINSTLKLIPTVQHSENQDLKYSIDTNYPQLTGGTLSPASKKFNDAITAMVKQEVDQFIKFVQEDAVHMKTLPVEMQHNTLDIDYDIDVINSSKEPIISVRLSVQIN